MKKSIVVGTALAVLIFVVFGIGAYAETWSIGFPPSQCVGKVITPDGKVFDPPGDTSCIYNLVEVNDKFETISVGYSNGKTATVYDARTHAYPPPYESKYDSEGESLSHNSLNGLSHISENKITPTTRLPVSTYNPITERYPLPTPVPTPKQPCQAAICWNGDKLGNGLENAGSSLWNGVSGAAGDLYRLFGQQ